MGLDAELTALIQQALFEDTRLSSQRVDVAVKRGVAHLTGQVRSHRRRLAARSVALSFEGCHDVVDEIEVEPLQQVPDADIADKVRLVLEAHADITQETMVVSVTSGIVTLEGSVSGHWERLLAADVALAVRGVRRVINNLSVDLLDHVEDASAADVINTAIRQTRGLASANVQVAVTGGTFVVTGTVDTLAQKETVLDVLNRYRTRAIRDEITVGSSAPSSDLPE